MKTVYPPQTKFAGGLNSIPTTNKVRGRGGGITNKVCGGIIMGNSLGLNGLTMV